MRRLQWWPTHNYRTQSKVVQCRRGVVTQWRHDWTVEQALHERWRRDFWMGRSDLRYWYLIEIAR